MGGFDIEGRCLVAIVGLLGGGGEVMDCEHERVVWERESESESEFVEGRVPRDFDNR